MKSKRAERGSAHSPASGKRWREFLTSLRDGMMRAADNIFRTGAYHKSFKSKHTHLIRQAQLRMFYRTSLRLIHQLGWPDPLARTEPHVLLCGTASPYTTVTFARFVSARNGMASMDILDISSYSLSQSERFL